MHMPLLPISPDSCLPEMFPVFPVVAPFAQGEILISQFLMRIIIYYYYYYHFHYPRIQAQPMMSSLMRIQYYEGEHSHAPQ
jgi:hypothetical protein